MILQSKTVRDPRIIFGIFFLVGIVVALFMDVNLQTKFLLMVIPACAAVCSFVILDPSGLFAGLHHVLRVILGIVFTIVVVAGMWVMYPDASIILKALPIAGTVSGLLSFVIFKPVES